MFDFRYEICHNVEKHSTPLQYMVDRKIDGTYIFSLWRCIKNIYRKEADNRHRKWLQSKYTTAPLKISNQWDVEQCWTVECKREETSKYIVNMFYCTQIHIYPTTESHREFTRQDLLGRKTAKWKRMLGTLGQLRSYIVCLLFTCTLTFSLLDAKASFELTVIHLVNLWGLD